MKKKILALVLSLVILLSSMAVVANAVEFEATLTDYPVILVPGYSSSELALFTDDTYTTVERRIWGLDYSGVIDIILNRAMDLSRGLVMSSNGSSDYLAKVVGEEVAAFLEYMATNPDGTSKYNVSYENRQIETTNMKYIRDNGLDESYISETALMDEIAGYIGEENVFVFCCDWRMNAYECANRLDSYIDGVLDYTGAEKVNLIAVSHGGQVSSFYLAMYGDKEKVNNAVLTVPAIGGAAMAYDPMVEQVDLPVDLIIHFVEHGNITEAQYEWLLEADQLDFLNPFINKLIPYIKEVLGTWGSLWDFIPLDYYEEAKAEFLDPVENAAVIEKSDRSHEIMANMHESLQKCRNEYGVNVNIIAGYGIGACTGNYENGDALIRTKDSTGAIVAPFGQRFNDGYTNSGEYCTDPTHDHVSPTFEIDASGAYLPENTWYVNELFHGMTFKDQYTRNLALRLLLEEGSGKITDVHSDANYPQYKASTNANNFVYACFEGNQDSTVRADKHNYLVVKNISTKYDITVQTIEFAGANLKTYNALNVTLKPGEETRVWIKGDITEGNKMIQAKVNFKVEDVNFYTTYCDKTFSFKTVADENAVYDGTLVDADYTMYTDTLNTETSDLLTVLGLSRVFEMIMNFFNYIFGVML